MKDTLNKKVQNIEYKSWIVDIKSKIQQRQIKAALSVNSELILLYWELGKEITEKQEKAKWGTGLINQLSEDLKKEFPNIGGFSKRNLHYCRNFYLFYNQNAIVQQVVAQIQTNDNHYIIDDCIKIPWGHNILIIQKAKSIQEATFYIKQTIENNWSRAILLNQIDSNLFDRQGKSISNFENTLPKAQSDLAKELLKDPYNFDFLQLTVKHNERELEIALIDKISQFLLELGTGFSFVGKQYNLKLEDKDYYLDLLFYHLKLRCFVVIELKIVEFQPEFAGKLNFYLNIVDDQLKHESDNPTIGIVICKNKNNIEAEYSLRGIKKPIGVSEYELTKILKEEFKGSLPTIEEIENELKNK